MNREQRRALAKRAQKHGMSKELAKTYAEIASGTGEHTKPQTFDEGDRIRLNVEAIKTRKNYERMSPMYKEFVEAAGDTIFTAHVERANMICYPILCSSMIFELFEKSKTCNQLRDN